ncbi:MAG: FadR/GntR family transcriptional regulator [Anaerolineae bacterium]
MNTESTSPAFPTIERPSVAQEVIENIKHALIRGELRAGQRLPSETALAQQMGVSRGSVREAMKVLAALGVVRIRQGDGTYLVDTPSSTVLSPLVFAVLLDSGTNSELFELRVLLQTDYCELAARKATEDDWARIEQAAKALEDYADNPDPDTDTLVQLDLGFHFAVLEATHNPLVIRISRTIEELFFASIRGTYLHKTENIQWAIQSHRSIIRAIREGDPDLIRQTVEHSLLHWKDEVEKSQRQGSVPQG